MTHQQLMHEIGIFVLGASACGLVQAYTPIAEPFKRAAVGGIAFVTILYMWAVAG